MDLPEKLKSFGEECFVLYDSGKGAGANRIIIFGCQDNFEVLAKSPIWLADGTFKAAPDVFKQVYTVHGFYEGYTLPCVHACLPNEKKLLPGNMADHL
jgi:hypothetical protein